ncbi:MAG: hypothetical protein DRO90_00420 [Candidatus Altiarchaeales archaeon]|nr:MAG: hypothetical protein DRO90_00420 [Candidatus Altiarchaeales archaeon]
MHRDIKMRKKTLKKILVPTDGSNAAIDAAKYAIKAAKRMKYGIVALSVINKYKLKNIASSFTGGVGWLSIERKFLEELRKEARKSVNLIKKMCEENNIPCNTAIREGFPHEEIIRYVNQNDDIILVVMGASGKDYVHRKILGGVTEKVVQEVSRKLPCPVVVTPSSDKVPNIRLDF